MPIRKLCDAVIDHPHSPVRIECALYAEHSSARHIERNGSHFWTDDGRIECNHRDRETSNAS